MEKEIDIAKILKNAPIGTKLYSPLFGNVFLKYIGELFITIRHHGTTANFYHNGRLYNYEGTEPMLYPSKEMRDWAKFAWKKGDVLSCGVDNLCIFEKWANEEYTEFYAKFVTPNYSGNTFKTEKWSKETNEAVIKQYISNIEELKGGKLNLTTLEIEKQLEFKDGDIAFADYGNRQDVFIVSDKTDLSEGYSSFISLDLRCLTLSMGFRTSFFKKDLCKLRLATKEEKQKLFDALAKEGKAWDAEKKLIVDLPKKCEFKPMDWCLMRDIRGEECFAWSLCQFAYQLESGKYEAVGGMRFEECIPYNEQTKHLLGTTDEWKGGEG